MRRVVFTLVTGVVVCAWAGAQGPTPLSPADQVKLLKMNRILIGNLIDDSLALANAGNETERAVACRKTARSLANALKAAAHDEDADRVTELAELMARVMRDGLMPNLDAATRLVQPNSPQAAQLAEVKKSALGDLDDIAAAVPLDSKLAGNPKVQESLAGLAQIKSRIVP